MLKTLEDIYKTSSIEASNGKRIPLHSHTSLEQGLFLQEILDDVKPSQTIEVGLAYGLSALFILEKHRQFGNKHKSHIMIEPGPEPWEGVAEYNIEKEGLTAYGDFQYDFSDKVLPKLYAEQHKIQFAYIDTTKRFDVVLQDFYFLDKMLEVNGVIVLDDCGGNWPGIQKVARFINTVPHYRVYKRHEEAKQSGKRKMAEKIAAFIFNTFQFIKRRFPAYSFKTDRQLKLNYYCLAFQKITEDQRDWKWDAPM